MGYSVDKEEELILKDLKGLRYRRCFEEMILEEGEGRDGRDEFIYVSVIYQGMLIVIFVGVFKRRVFKRNLLIKSWILI